LFKLRREIPANSVGDRIKAGLRSAIKDIKRDKYLLLLISPGVLFLILFKYIPMGGIVIAFKNYSIFKGIWDSDWVGFENFRRVFSSSDFLMVLRNTLIISTYNIIFVFPVPIILSIILNEIRSRYFKKIVQTVIYMPHFVSWVVIAGIMLSVLSPTYGIAKEVFEFLGRKPIVLMASRQHFRTLLVLSSIWKESGWGTIIYLAAFSTIDPNLYEAAVVDGAGKLRRIWNITLPSIKGVIVLLLIINIGNIMNAGFDQILAMQNDLVRPVSDVFETYVFRRGLQRGDYSFSAAMELFKSVVACILVFSADKFAKRIGEEGIL
jgi:putative aldouronate transport system permease protein